MAAEITIVTNKVFIKSKGIISAGLSDQIVYDDSAEATKSVYWRIDMYYLYDTLGSGNNAIDSRHFQIEIKDRREAHAEFLEIVKQIRDQNPDDNMINSLFEKALTANEMVQKEEKKDKKKKGKR